MTGEIDIYSRVHSVGGASAKIQGAIDAGCKYVFIPRENAEALRPEELERFRKAINIIPTDSLSQIIDAVSMKQTV